MSYSEAARRGSCREALAELQPGATKICPGIRSDIRGAQRLAIGVQTRTVGQGPEKAWRCLSLPSSCSDYCASRATAVKGCKHTAKLVQQALRQPELDSVGDDEWLRASRGTGFCASCAPNGVKHSGSSVGFWAQG